MYCPMCGSKMTRYLMDDDDSSDDNSDGSEKYGCPQNKCFDEKSYPLIKHGVGDIRNEPGDSWSLTWLK